MKIWKRMSALALIAALLLCSGMLNALAEENGDASAQSADYYNGVFSYCPGTLNQSAGADRFDTYMYSDDYFRSPSTDYNAHLATMSMAVCEASGTAAAGYAAGSRNLEALLEDIGFTDFAANDAYRKKPTKDSVGVACAHKTITEGDRTYTLLAVVPRSAGCEAELGNGLIIGASGDAEGFAASAEKALTFVRGYITDHDLSGNLKIWAAGFSRGAGIVNLAAKKLIDAPETTLGTAVKLSPENLYAYTFATPPAAEAKGAADEKYSVIYNHISDTDITVLIPPTEMGFARCGTVITLNSAENKERMLQLLKVSSPSSYSAYVKSGDPDHFMPKEVNSSFSIVDDPKSYIPADARTYLSGLSQYAAQFTGGRSSFASGAQKPLSNLLSFYGALTVAQAQAFQETLANHKDTINELFSLYAYFMRLKSQNGGRAGLPRTGLDAQEIAATAASSDTEFTEYELYELGMRMLRYMRSSPDTILSDAAGYLKTVLTASMKASGATSTQISSVTGTNDLKALAKFLAHLLFGNIWQSTAVDAYDLHNEQLKNAVTLLENYEALFGEHNSEVYLAWLRARDSFCDNYASPTAAQRTGYRRVRLTAADGTAPDGVVKGASGETIAEIRAGVLVNSADPWLGFTTADDGGFLRVPFDCGCTVELSAETGCTLDVTVDEYDVKTARATTALKQTAEVPAGAAVTVELPAAQEAFAIPSGLAYTVTVTLPEDPRLLGDADSDGAVTVLDATAIQRWLAKIEAEIDEDAANVDRDAEISILDATYIQRWLANLSCPEGIGEAINASL